MNINNEVLYKTKLDKSRFRSSLIFFILGLIFCILLLEAIISSLIYDVYNTFVIFYSIMFSIVIITLLQYLIPLFNFFFKFHRLIIKEKGIVINPLPKKRTHEKRERITIRTYYSFNEIENIELKEEYEPWRRETPQIKNLYIYPKNNEPIKLKSFFVKNIEKVKEILEKKS